MNKAILKYLNQYSETETALAEDFPERHYDHALVIPAYLESADFLVRLGNKTPEENFLLILVSNHPDGLNAEQLQKAQLYHSQLCDYLGSTLWTCGHLSLHKTSSFDVLLVDRTGKDPIAAKSGVGLARKIGADVALVLYSRGLTRSSWFMATDADTRLPKDYFQVKTENQAVALLYPFEHIVDKTKISRATWLYEQSIRHYVSGLEHAGSPYAFHTIGSLMSINFDAYASARGYPKRAAGEDFYLLNKLAKLGSIQNLEQPKILIESRVSNRTPFGTGPSVDRLLNSSDMLSEVIFYNPVIFDQLSLVLKSYQSNDLGELEVRLAKLPEETRQVLDELYINKMLEAAERQSFEGAKLHKHIDDWFDGFKTLKFVHLMRDRHLPSLSYRDLFHKNPF